MVFQKLSRFSVMLLFLDEKGREVSDKLIGIWSVDFYGGFIDERIDSARGQVHSKILIGVPG